MCSHFGQNRKSMNTMAYPANQPTISSRRTGQSCPTHATKRGDLYCLTCELVVCSECLLGSREHTRHSVDNVRDTYVGRYRETINKLEALNQHINSLSRSAEERLVVLETLRRNEKSMLERLDRITSDARAEVTRVSQEYAEQLEPFILTTQHKSHNRDRLWSKIAGLSEGEFLMQQAELDKQCDVLMGNSLSNVPALSEGSGSIACSLLPAIETTCHDLKLDSRRFVPFSNRDRFGIRWNLQLERTNKLTLHVETKELDELEGNFLIVLEILDRLPLKNIRINMPFQLPDSSTFHQITKVLTTNFSQLQSEGFVAKDGLLRIKCGIGPEDPMTERNCYEYTLRNYRSKLKYLQEELLEWRKYSIGHFLMTNCPPFGSKRTKIQQSPTLVDENGVRWQLKVAINGRKGIGFVGTFLTKTTGRYEGWYDYFIELVHGQSEQKNRIVKGCYQYDKCRTLELPQFVTVAFLDQFLENGTLRFRYGTKLEHQQANRR